MTPMLPFVVLALTVCSSCTRALVPAGDDCVVGSRTGAHHHAPAPGLCWHEHPWAWLHLFVDPALQVVMARSRAGGSSTANATIEGIALAVLSIQRSRRLLLIVTGTSKMLLPIDVCSTAASDPGAGGSLPHHSVSTATVSLSLPLMLLPLPLSL